VTAMLGRRASKPVPPSTSVLIVALADRRVAVPAGQIVEVFRIGAYTRLPCEDPTNLGIVLHREMLIPLVDLALRLGGRRGGPVRLPGLCLFVETDAGEIGFPIDRVLGLASVPGDGADRAVPLLDPAVLGGGHAQSPAR
jgi:chemotaxis signal transduction protein